MATLKTLHHKPYTRNGDTESTIELIETQPFKTKKLAKEYIERKLLGHNKVIKKLSIKEEPYCIIFTGKTWVNENSGELCEEFFKYVITK